jgi:hypothetical protein
LRGTDVRTISCRNSLFPIFFWHLSRLPTSIALSSQEVKLNKHRQPRRNQKSLQKSLFFLFALAIAPLAFGQTPATAPPDDAPVRERANLLLKQMTPEEKIGQLSQLFDFGKEKAIDQAVSSASHSPPTKKRPYTFLLEMTN